VRLDASLGSAEENGRERLNHVGQFVIVSPKEVMGVVCGVPGFPVWPYRFGHKRTAKDLDTLVVIKLGGVEQFAHQFANGFK